MLLTMPFRIRAFLIHLLLSIGIASITIFVVFCVWYVSPLAKAVGVTHIFLMMLAIDVILGPLLTLLIAKQGKKTLKFDLVVIGLLQLLALVYGLYNITITRPTYIAFDAIRFEVVQENTIPKQDREKAQSPYNQTNWLSPKWVAVSIAQNTEEKNRRTFVELEYGTAPSMQPSLYEPLENQWHIVMNQASNLDKLSQFNQKNDVDTVLQKYPQATNFLPLKAYEMDMTVLIDDKNKKIIDIVDLRPW